MHIDDACGIFVKFRSYPKKAYTAPLISLVVFALAYGVLRGPTIIQTLSRDTLYNAGHNLILVLLNTLLVALYFSAIAASSLVIFETYNLPHIPVETWNALPTPVLFLIILLALDFANYWAHRLLHTDVLWGIHALHHSDTAMTWTTSYRIHVFEFVVMKITFLFILGWLFLPIEWVAVAGIVRTWHSEFIHCQLGWTFGRFKKVLASPNFHRWHHADVPEAYGKNFCDMFPLWDIMFGTYYDPGPCHEKIGVKELPPGFLMGQAYPFVYTFEAVKSRISRMTKKITAINPSQTP